MFRFLTSLIATLLMTASVFAQEPKLYELRTYHSEPGRQRDTLDLMSQSALENMKRHKIELIGVWTPLDSADERVFMLVSHVDKDSATQAWTAYQNDPQWKESLKKSEKDGKKPVASIERVFMTTNSYSPKLEKTPTAQRILELRTYIATPNNLAALNKRFENHTLELFKKHGITNILYWSVAKGEKTTSGELLKAVSPIGKSAAEVEPNLPAVDNALIYFIAHQDADAARASFGKFREDPNWQKALKDSEASAGGSLTVKDGVKSLYLVPATFSPLK